MNGPSFISTVKLLPLTGSLKDSTSLAMRTSSSNAAFGSSPGSSRRSSRNSTRSCTVWVEFGKLWKWLTVSVCLPSCGWLLSSFVLVRSRWIASIAPVIALAPSHGRAEWQGEPFTVANTSMRPRFPSVIFSPVPPSTAMSARTPAPSTTLLMASCLPVSPERQQVKMSLPVIGTFAGDDGFHRVQIGGEIGLLLARALAHHAFAGQVVFGAVDHVAVVGIGHGGGRLVHGVADEHQRLAAGACAIGRDQIAHGVIADVGKAHGAQPRLDRLLDELLEQRLIFQEIGLRAWDLDELDQQFLRALARELGIEEFLDFGRFHSLVLHVTSAPPLPSRFFTPGQSTSTTQSGENRSRQRAQHEHRIVMIGNLQRLVERAFGELAEDQSDHQADQRIAMPPARNIRTGRSAIATNTSIMLRSLA